MQCVELSLIVVDRLHIPLNLRFACSRVHVRLLEQRSWLVPKHKLFVLPHPGSSRLTLHRFESIEALHVPVLDLRKLLLIILVEMVVGLRSRVRGCLAERRT